MQLAITFPVSFALHFMRVHDALSYNLFLQLITHLLCGWYKVTIRFVKAGSIDETSCANFNGGEAGSAVAGGTHGK